MNPSLTLEGWTWKRAASLVAGTGMVLASYMTIRHFFAANYPESIWQGSFCDISAFFNCDSSAYSSIAEIGGVPIGVFGAIVGGLVVLGALLPSAPLERTNKSIALINGVGVVTLALYSVFVLGSLCLLCTGFYVASLLSLFLFWRYGIDRDAGGFVARWLRPSTAVLLVLALFTVTQAWAAARYHEAKRDAQSGGVAARVVKQYFALPEVAWPSEISEYRTASATDDFEDAPIRIVEFGDPLCSDCQYLHEQMLLLKDEFAGQMNVAFQFFPLEASCNDVVEKDKHPGACELSYILAHDPAAFPTMIDEVFADFEDAKTPEWRAELARRYGVDSAASDSATIETVSRHIATGAEYEKTSDEYAHGIRSTPTMIINNRMVIGTFPYEQLRAIFQALVAEAAGDTRFMESWVE
ncbi:MAG: thioredoxin domain-containing protein [Gemmatimonadetes bacterium]|nr:thioredoxin domain-containing protein [Gemmatimonadota bacterium]